MSGGRGSLSGGGLSGGTPRAAESPAKKKRTLSGGTPRAAESPAKGGRTGLHEGESLFPQDMLANDLLQRKQPGGGDAEPAGGRQRKRAKLVVSGGGGGAEDAAPAPARIKLKSGAAEKTEKEKLTRDHAMDAAQAWYDTSGPFAGTYTMDTPHGAFRNSRKKWSLKYMVTPDTGIEYFVQFEFARDSSRQGWMVIGISEEEASTDEKGNSKGAAVEAPAAPAPARIKLKSGAAEKTEKEKLTRDHAMDAAQAWYDTSGPFAGTYTMDTPHGAFRNSRKKWSLKYMVTPDTGIEYFVQFEFAREATRKGTQWMVVGISEEEASQDESSSKGAELSRPPAEEAAVEAPAAAAPARIKLKSSTVEKTEKEKLSREFAIEAARGWYDTQGPFAGTYSMGAPSASYQNSRKKWSLRCRLRV